MKDRAYRHTTSTQAPPPDPPLAPSDPAPPPAKKRSRPPGVRQRHVPQRHALCAPKEGRATGAAPPEAQATDVVAAASRVGSVRRGDVSPSAEGLSAGRKGSTAATATATTAAGCQTTLRRALPGRAAPPVTA